MPISKVSWVSSNTTCLCCSKHTTRRSKHYINQKVWMICVMYSSDIDRISNIISTIRNQSNKKHFSSSNWRNNWQFSKILEKCSTTIRIYPSLIQKWCSANWKTQTSNYFTSWTNKECWFWTTNAQTNLRDRDTTWSRSRHWETKIGGWWKPKTLTRVSSRIRELRDSCNPSRN